MDLHPPSIVHVRSDDNPVVEPTSPLSTAPNSPRTSPIRTPQSPVSPLPTYDFKRQNSELGRESRISRLRAQAKMLFDEKKSDSEDELALKYIPQPIAIAKSKEEEKLPQRMSRLEQFIEKKESSQKGDRPDELMSTMSCTSSKVQQELLRRRRTQTSLFSRVQSELQRMQITATPFDEGRGEGSEDERKQVVAGLPSSSVNNRDVVYSKDQFADLVVVPTDEMVPADEALLDESAPMDEIQGGFRPSGGKLSTQVVEVQHAALGETKFSKESPPTRTTVEQVPATQQEPTKKVSVTQELLAKLKKARKRTEPVEVSGSVSPSNLSKTPQRDQAKVSISLSDTEAITPSPDRLGPVEIQEHSSSSRSSEGSKLIKQNGAPTAEPSPKVGSERSKSPERSKGVSISLSRKSKSPLRADRGSASPKRSGTGAAPSTLRSVRTQTSPPKSTDTPDRAKLHHSLSPEQAAELENQVFEPRASSPILSCSPKTESSDGKEAALAKYLGDLRQKRMDSRSTAIDVTESTTHPESPRSLLSDSSGSDDDDVVGPLQQDRLELKEPSRLSWRDDSSSSDETPLMSNGFFKGRRQQSKSQQALDQKSKILPYGEKGYQDYWTAKKDRIRAQQNQLRDLYGQAKKAKKTDSECCGSKTMSPTQEPSSPGNFTKNSSESLLSLPALVVDQEQLRSIGVKALTTVCNGIGSLFLHPDSASKVLKQQSQKPSKVKAKRPSPRLEPSRSKSPAGRIRSNRRRRQAVAKKIDDREEAFFAASMERSLEAQKRAESIGSSASNMSTPARPLFETNLKEKDDQFWKDVESDKSLNPCLDDTSNSSDSVPPAPPAVPVEPPKDPIAVPVTTPSSAAPFDECEVVIEDSAEWSLARAIQERVKRTDVSPRSEQSEPDGSTADSLLLQKVLPRESKDSNEKLGAIYKPFAEANDTTAIVEKAAAEETLAETVSEPPKEENKVRVTSLKTDTSDTIEKPPSIKRVNVGLDLDNSLEQAKPDLEEKADEERSLYGKLSTPDPNLTRSPMSEFLATRVLEASGPLLLTVDADSKSDSASNGSSTDELLTSLDDMIKDLDGLANARRGDESVARDSESLTAEALSFSDAVDVEKPVETPLMMTSNDNGLETLPVNDDMPFLVSMIDNDIGIQKGDIMMSLLNYDGAEPSSWTQRVDDSVWRCRTMRRHCDIHWSEQKAAMQPSPMKSLLNEIRVIGGINDVPSTQRAALEHLKYDNLDDALILYEDICLTYQAQSQRMKRNDDPRFPAFKRYVATALHNLGLVHLLRGEHEEAFSFFSDACEIRADCLGVGHKDHIVSMVKAAVCRVALDDYSTAYSELEEALLHAREETATLPDYRQLAEILNNLGCLAYMGGKHDRSMLYFRESEKVQRAIAEQSVYIGSRFSCLSMTLNMSVTQANIGFLLLLSRDLPGSISMFESAMKSQELLLRDAHISLISTMEHLVVANLLSGRKLLALQLLRRISNMQTDAFGPKDRRGIATETKIALLVSKEIHGDDSPSRGLPVAEESEMWESPKLNDVDTKNEQTPSGGCEVLISI